MTILNRAILAIMLWTTLEAGTAMSAIVQPLVYTDWVAENLSDAHRSWRYPYDV